jgi:simple sugar transport system ATP-binding protein
MSYALELRGIVKRFPGVLANDHIDLAVEPGEIRALVGENGAGKTTLMRILYGLYQPDAGEIFIHGQRQAFHSPHDAIRAGLGMVHQHFMLFPSLSVSENVIYGAEPTQAGFIDRQAARQRVAEIAERYSLQVDPAATVGQLPVGVRQRVEILKTLYRQAEILILDEPTAVLTPQERDGLFTILRGLARQGKTIIFITHKLHEVMNLSDQATVLQGGRVTATLRTAETSPEEISRFMVGREVMFVVNKPPVLPGETVLAVENLAVAAETGRTVLQDLSFQVRAGEIVGIAGVAGNGQTELIEAITGLRPITGGRIKLARQDVSRASVAGRRKAGQAFIPEDRSRVGLALPASVTDNLLMGFQREPVLSRRGLLSWRGVGEHASRLIKQYAIKVTQPTEPATNLSGGNLQKVVVAREFSHRGRLLIAEQPTRGVDVGSIEFIHQRLLNYRSEGNAILLVSAELSEIMSLSDRILVMFEGRIVGELTSTGATEARLGLLMAGGNEKVRNEN